MLGCIEVGRMAVKAGNLTLQAMTSEDLLRRIASRFPTREASAAGWGAPVGSASLAWWRRPS